MDGKLLLVTNTQDLTPEQVIERYKSLADIERGFRVLQSDIEIGPTTPFTPAYSRPCVDLFYGADYVSGEAPTP